MTDNGISSSATNVSSGLSAAYVKGKLFAKNSSYSVRLLGAGTLGA